MNVFYNREGIGDTLLITLKAVDPQVRAFEKKEMSCAFSMSRQVRQSVTIFFTRLHTAHLKEMVSSNEQNN